MKPKKGIATENRTIFDTIITVVVVVVVIIIIVVVLVVFGLTLSELGLVQSFQFGRQEL